MWPSGARSIKRKTTTGDRDEGLVSREQQYSEFPTLALIQGGAVEAKLVSLL